MKNIYGPIRVSTDAYIKILTAQELNRESSEMRGDRNTLCCCTRNDSCTIPTHTDKYGLVLNGRSPARSQSLQIYYYLARGQLPTTFRACSIEAFTNAKDHMRS